MKQKATDQYSELANELVEGMDISPYSLLDYSNCLYEGDIPSIDHDLLKLELERVLRAKGILNR